jgi:hypothetical protein
MFLNFDLPDCLLILRISTFVEEIFVSARNVVLEFRSKVCLAISPAVESVILSVQLWDPGQRTWLLCDSVSLFIK